MDKNAIKKYAVWARNELIARVTQKAEQYEITEKKTTPKDADSINGRLLTEAEKNQRKALIEKIQTDGFEQVMEEVAYTWFNRFTALRFMEVNNYLPSHTRVFTNETGEFKPQILTDAIQLDLEGLDMDKVFELKDANKTEELYKYLLITQCNALSAVLPRMFQKIEHYTELLLPDYLLREGSVIEQMISMIPEETFDVNTEGGQIEIIGWLYQYYISEKHEEVVDPLHGKIIKKEEIPAATQLFTTDWVVRYLIDNSVGRYWIERNPNSSLADELKYFVKSKDGTVKTIDEKIIPQDVTVFDPCVGSGHFLIYAFDVLMKIYEEYGYSEREAAAEIVTNNLFGLDIDGRASQLAYFSIMMKARQYDRRFFSRKIQPHVFEINESNNVDKLCVEHFCSDDLVLKKDVYDLLETLRNAKEYGTILKMPIVDFERINNRFVQIENEISMYKMYLLDEFRTLVQSAEIMSEKYAVVATNPPYMNKYDTKLKKYLLENYKKCSGDLFSVFIYRDFEYCKDYGYSALMTPNVWLYISTYEYLRRYVLDYKAISSLVYIAKGSFFKEATVDVCAFVLSNSHSKEAGTYYDLSSYKNDMQSQGKAFLKECKNSTSKNRYERETTFFDAVDGYPVAFSLTDAERECFLNYKRISEYISFKQGIATSDNKRFLRLWHECDYGKIGFGLTKEEAKQTDFKWFPYNKGGDYRKWYGNNEYVINYQHDGAELRAFHEVLNKEHPGGRLKNSDYYFREGVTWSVLTSGSISLRYSPKGQLFDSKGSMGFTDNTAYLKYCMGFINSQVCNILLEKIVPTLDFNLVYMNKLPMRIEHSKLKSIVSIVDQCIDIAKKDWDSYETSWDFKRDPLIMKTPLIRNAWEMLSRQTKENRDTLISLERELNQLFVSIYNIDDEIIDESESGKIVLREASESLDIKALISYAVGCMFGRYSLDYPGLAFAGGVWDASKYTTYQPDRDAIIPICDDEYFNDDIVGRFIKFVEVVYGKETLEDNLQFIAQAIGGKGTSREVIRNYFINDFYSDHLKTYQKRPIYWLFDSGKKNGFKCLVYMHRYKQDTIARIRTDYVHEQQSRYRTAIADLENRINGVGTTERVKLNKHLAKLRDQAMEIREYEEKIHHLADQMISINLDDGVKHNYEIFKDVLAKIK